MILIIIGPQASGKGTQSVSLKDKIGLVHLSTGHVLRDIAKKETPLGKKVDRYINKKGILVPDNIIIKVIERFLTKKNLKKGIIFDGFPRNKNQLKIFIKLLSKKQVGISKVFYIKASNKIIKQRLSGRLVCSGCGKNYHITNMPPRKKGVCDLCRSRLEKREDETPETIENRLAVYRKETAPLLSIYRKMGVLEEINGDEPPKNVFADILARLKKAGLTK